MTLGCEPVLKVRTVVNTAVVAASLRRRASKRPADPQDVLLWAAGRGRLIDVRRALRDQASVEHARTDDGSSALHVAAANGHCDVVAHLVTRGAKPDEADGPGQATPLLSAVMAGQVDMVAFLLRAGADANAALEDGRTAMHCAVQTGSMGMCVLLGQAGARLDRCDAGGRTALHLAAQRGDVHMTEWLLAAGVPLHWRASEGAPAASAALAGQADDKQRYGRLAASCGEKLIEAARRGDVETACC